MTVQTETNITRQWKHTEEGHKRRTQQETHNNDTIENYHTHVHMKKIKRTIQQTNTDDKYKRKTQTNDTKGNNLRNTQTKHTT